MKSYYHYTNKGSVATIISSGYIRKSTDTVNDALFGPGKKVCAVRKGLKEERVLITLNA